MDCAENGDILKQKDINKMREQQTMASGFEHLDNGGGSRGAESSPSEFKENSSDNPKATRRSIKDYILDKPFRIRSYLRRRPIPLKRCLELDIQCGTKSFHLQISPDIDEAVYCGAPDLVDLFLKPSGLKLSDVCRILAEARDLQEGKEEQDQEDHSDEDFFDSIKSKNKRDKEARAELAKRLAEVEFLRSPVDRAKKFKSSKEGIFAKIDEIERVCGVVSLTVIVNPEKDLCCYSGDPGLITDFFTRGVARNHLGQGWNVRQFDCEEVEYNVCSVPACVVSRNTLGKWRQAALDLFHFPPSLPLSLHPCPAVQRDRWMAELDLEPHNKARVVVCSLHFRDGRPTKENPFPTELLGESREAPVYRGRRPEEEQGQDTRKVAQGVVQEVLELLLGEVEGRIDVLEQRKEEEMVREREKDVLRRREISAHRNIRYRQLKPTVKRRRKRVRMTKTNIVKTGGINKKPLKVRRGIKTGLQCRMCNTHFSFTRALYHHVTSTHCRAERELEPSKDEREQALASLYPAEHTAKRLDPKKKYVCAVCKSVCDLLGLFVHMKQVHHGLLCQYCLKLFKKVRDLEHHLVASHRLPSRYYSSLGQLREVSGCGATLACGECSVLLSLEQAEQHNCSSKRYLECPLCRQVEASQDSLERHLTRCARLPGGPDTARSQAVRLAVLTGRPALDTGDSLLLPVQEQVCPPPAPVLAKHQPLPAPVARKPVFSCSDRNVLVRYGAGEAVMPEGRPVLDHLPGTGTIFWGSRARGISNHVKKEFKDLGQFIDLGEEIKKAGQEVEEIDQEILGMKIEQAGKNFIVSLPRSLEEEEQEEVEEEPEEQEQAPVPEEKVEEESPRLESRLESKQERVARLEQEIQSGLLDLRAVIDRQTSCLFCQQCKTVWVEATFLLSHLVVVHQGGEDTTAAIHRIKRLQRDTRGREVMFRYTDTEETFSFDFYRCSYCSTTDCKTYTELFAHTAAVHSTKVLTCNICQNIFLNYGSLISHVCCGPPTSTAAKARFACKVCHKMDLSSFIDFQTHIRSAHHTCEICFQPLGDQMKLYDHCATHEQDSFCLSCFVSFEKADSFKKHLVLKHGSDAKECGHCYAPTWPHVYHFCRTDLPIVCQACHETLPNSSAYRVHQRRHTGVQPHACSTCGKRFISKSLLWKHLVRRHPEENQEAAKSLAAKKLRKDCERLGATNVTSVEVVQELLTAWLDTVVEGLKEPAPPPDPVTPEKEPEKPPVQASALDAAIASIMPSDDPTPAPEPDGKEPTPSPEVLPPKDRAAIQASIAERQYTPDTSWQAGLDALLAGAGAPVVASSGSDSTVSPEKPSQPANPVMSGLWNQDLLFVQGPGESSRSKAAGGLRTLQPSGDASATSPVAGIRSLEPTVTTPLTRTQWDLDLSESSGDETMGPQPRRTPALKQRTVTALRPLLDHDYCYAAYLSSQQPVLPPAPPPPQEMSEMDKILSNVAFGGFSESPTGGKERREGEKKKKKKKKKKKRKKEQVVANSKRSDSSSDSESDIDVGENNAVDMFGIQARQKLTPGGGVGARPGVLPAARRGRGRPKKPGQLPLLILGGTPGGKRGPKPKYHTPDAAVKAMGVVAGTARPSFDTDSSEHRSSDSEQEHRRRKVPEKAVPVDLPSNSDTLGSSDLETDFSAEEEPVVVASKIVKTPKTIAVKTPKPPPAAKPALKLKIKLPPQPERRKSQGGEGHKVEKRHKVSKRRRSSTTETGSPEEKEKEKDGRPISKKMRESLALNARTRLPTSGSDEEAEEGTPKRPAVAVATAKLYCYCQCPHDEVSEMIGCDAPDCLLEWFHFECVGIMVPPEGKWYCPQCTKRYGL